MNKRILLSITLVILACRISYSQSLSATATTTPTICYNDGKLIVNATGGTGPYTDSILTGPSNPNLIYPIGLPTGQDTFFNLPHGTFHLSVNDAAGHRYTFYVNLGGTYLFPSDTLYQTTFYNVYSINYANYLPQYLNRDTLYCTVKSGTGTAPFQYAISSSGANSGFGAYQSTTYFTHLCTGEYWVRVRDNCGNIYTSSLQFSDTMYVTALCFNTTAGTATLQHIGGVAPYTYSVMDGNNGTVLATNQTGIFSGLPSLTDYTFKVIDSCGKIATGQMQRPYPFFNTDCPYDSIINISYTSQYASLPLTFTCLNCTPVQQVTLNTNNGPVFHHIPPGVTSQIEMKDGCGNRDTVMYTTSPSRFLIDAQFGATYIGCNSFVLNLYYTDFTQIPNSQIDSIAILGYHQRFVSRSDTFYHLMNPNGLDTFEVYMHGGCIGIGTGFQLYLPHMPGCSRFGHDANCHPICNLDYGDGYLDFPENFYLIKYNTYDTLKESPPGGYNGAYFDSVSPGYYQLASSGGCVTYVTVDSFPKLTHTVASYVTCTGQSVIDVTGIDSSNPYGNGVYSCGPAMFLTRFYQNGTLMMSDTTEYNLPLGYINGHHKTFHPLPADTGIYQYKIYYLNYPVTALDTAGRQFTINFNTHYDSICPVDTGSVLVTHRSVPFPYAQTVYKCSGVAAGPLMLTIYGGSIPYTVQIAGLDTFIMHVNSVPFPTTNTGTYNIIAYDNCGISRSFTFSIMDTCLVCGGVNAGRDTSICSGRSAHLTATPRYSGGIYLWSPGGATSQGITVSPSITTPYIVTYTQAGCAPVRDTVIISVSTAPTVSVSDTNICSGGSATLLATPSQSGGSYSWSPGGSTSQSITVSPATNATYTVTYSLAGCASVIDTAYITVSPAPSVSVMDTNICAGTSVTLTATPSQSGGSYSWSPGGASTQSITISPTTTASYIVTYSLPGCTAARDTSYVIVSAAPTVSVRDTNICVGSSVTLAAVPSQNGGSYSWSPGGATTQNITVSPTTNASYTVTYSLAGCAAARDTAYVTVSAAPTVSVSDTNICSGGSAILIATASQSGGSYNWSPGGATTQSITVSPTSNASYTVTYSLAGCTAARDTSYVTVSAAPTVSVRDTTICSGSSVTLIAIPSQNGGSYSWSQGGATTQSITVSPTSNATYTVTYNLAGCTAASDTVYVTVSAAPTVSVRDTSICSGSSVTLTATPSQSGGSYSWSPGGATTQSITVSPAHSSTYIIHYALSSCPVQADSTTVFVYSLPLGYWGYTVSSGYTYHFADTLSYGLGPFTYMWDFGDGSHEVSAVNTTHIYQTSGIYTAALIISDPCGSDTISKILNVATGIINVDLSDKISIYPNPNHGTFTLSVSDMSSTGLTAEVTDILGRTVYKESIHTGKNTLQLDLTKGVYTVKVTDGNSQAVKILTIE